MRSVLCKYYRDCLNKTIAEYLPDFTCAGCAHKNEAGYVEQTDFVNYYLLLLAIFKPDFYRMYRVKQKYERL